MGLPPPPAASQNLPAPQQPPLRWWKGNLHAHTYWDDGHEYPCMVVDWYKRRGYHFLALSPHDRLMHGKRLVSVDTKPGASTRLAGYRSRFGERRARCELSRGRKQVPLKTIAELRADFEAPQRFLLLQAEEITGRCGRTPVHLNAINLSQVIRPRGGDCVGDVLQNNVDAVRAQGQRLRQPMLVQINHPNYRWAITAKDIAAVRGARFFEVYNGHPRTGNRGDARHVGTDRMWDEILSLRLSGPDPEPMYGVAADDAHYYHGPGANPGRGWIVVRARRLSAPDLIAAMEAGDFYASTGVRLADLRSGGGRLSLTIVPEPGVTYTTRFVGTRRGREGVGVTLAEVAGTSASYSLRGDELYVRALVLSSKPHPNPCAPGDLEVAWTQPLLARAGVTPLGRRPAHDTAPGRRLVRK